MPLFRQAWSTVEISHLAWSKNRLTAAIVFKFYLNVFLSLAQIKYHSAILGKHEQGIFIQCLGSLRVAFRLLNAFKVHGCPILKPCNEVLLITKNKNGQDKQTSLWRLLCLKTTLLSAEDIVHLVSNCTNSLSVSLWTWCVVNVGSWQDNNHCSGSYLKQKNNTSFQ